MICLCCGNIGEFREDIIYKELSRETVIYDGKTEAEEDYVDNETFDSERNYEENFRCGECDSNDCKRDLNEKGILDIKWRHTDKKFKWHEDELEEEERNKRIGNKLLALSI